MNPRSLEKNLANIERELVDLQTAHEVGLGMVGFYEYSGSHDTFIYDRMSYFILMIDVADGERVDPIINAYISSLYGAGENENGFSSIDKESSNKFYVSCLIFFRDVPSNIQYKVISTSKLNMRVAEDWEDFQEWLNG